MVATLHRKEPVLNQPLEKKQQIVEHMKNHNNHIVLLHETRVNTSNQEHSEGYHSSLQQLLINTMREDVEKREE